MLRTDNQIMRAEAALAALQRAADLLRPVALACDICEGEDAAAHVIDDAIPTLTVFIRKAKDQLADELEDEYMGRAA